MTQVGENLRQMLEGSSNLPDSAKGSKQKKLSSAEMSVIPSKKQTQQDIAEADARDKAIRIAQEATRKPQVESKPTGLGVDMGSGLQRLLATVEWNMDGRKGKSPKDLGYKSLPEASSYIDRYGMDSVSLVGIDNITNEGWLDKSDAARHALLAGDLSRRTNPTVAKIGMGLYELLSGNPFDKDAKMDFHNNAVAAEAMKNAKSYEEVKTKTKEMLDKASYQDFTDKGRLVFLK